MFCFPRGDTFPFLAVLWFHLGEKLSQLRHGMVFLGDTIPGTATTDQVSAFSRLGSQSNVPLSPTRQMLTGSTPMKECYLYIHSVLLERRNNCARHSSRWINFMGSLFFLICLFKLVWAIILVHPGST